MYKVQHRAQNQLRPTNIGCSRLEISDSLVGYYSYSFHLTTNIMNIGSWWKYFTSDCLRSENTWSWQYQQVLISMEIQENWNYQIKCKKWICSQLPNIANLFYQKYWTMHMHSRVTWFIVNKYALTDTATYKLPNTELNLVEIYFNLFSLWSLVHTNFLSGLTLYWSTCTMM